MKMIKCRESYKEWEVKEAEERKRWLEAHGIKPVLQFRSTWFRPYILTWYVPVELAQ